MPSWLRTWSSAFAYPMGTATSWAAYYEAQRGPRGHHMDAVVGSLVFWEHLRELLSSLHSVGQSGNRLCRFGVGSLLFAEPSVENIPMI
jgi:hypothetical protein